MKFETCRDKLKLDCDIAMLNVPKSCHTKLTYHHIKVICGKSLITLSIETTLIRRKCTLILPSILL